jgi:hypothetical protein
MKNNEAMNIVAVKKDLFTRFSLQAKQLRPRAFNLGGKLFA